MNIKRITIIVLSFVLIASLFSENFSIAHAQAAVPNDAITFASLGQQDVVLTGPLDSKGLDFNLPADWSPHRV